MRTLTEQKRTEILDSASSVFLDQGYERASMDGIAKKAGCSKATLYNYFSSKESLFEMVVRTYSTNYLTGAASELKATESDTFTLSEKLQRFGEGMLGVMMSDWKALQLFRMVVGEAGHSDIGELFYESGVRESMNALTEVMAYHIDNGDLTDSIPVLRARQFSALVKAEADELLFKRNIPAYTEAEVSMMVTGAVELFVKGAGQGSIINETSFSVSTVSD
ncbi:TetR-family transcriptional regulator (plasmid) [Erwinia billingiae Eb661]|uniref:TetR-family transcriptional regulator n=1 Tax=Erwinia billingiae (strain Eb661) TaxID=634500 RepID=D8MJM6_ERWBE|nr:TetR/AcrR family transcriptional regulator [Erwinia billingiae]CAX53474.1 TetR-family transcriptional regulator [Erwinia billingiae Eb661]